MSFDNLVEVLAGCEFFSAFEPNELRQLAEKAEARHFKFGDTIFNHQDRGDGMFVIKSGTVRIFAEDNGKEVSLGVRRSGEVIAEIAALREHHHEYSARASGKTELLFLPRSAVTAVLSANQDASAFVARYVMLSAAGGFVTRLFNLRGKFEREEMEDIIRSIGIKRIKAGEVILQQGGQDEQRLHLIRQGSVGISYSEDGVEYHLATLRQGDVFGEQACLRRQPQAFTASADSDSTILVIPQQTVQTILERNPALEDSLNKHINTLERELKRQQQLTERRKRPFLLDLSSKPKPGERLIKRFALVEQAEEMDCGAACLSMICRHYNIPITLGKLREMANVTTEGATLESLARVGESLGFTTRGLQCNYEVLLGFDLPFIAHWEGYHYIVVYGVSKHHVWVADPGAGFRKLGVAEFEKGWTGTCLLFTPGTDMVQLAAARSPWVRFVRFLRPHKKTLGYLLLAALVIEALGVAPPVIIQNILDRVVVHQNVGLLHLLIVGFVLTQIFIHVSGLLRTLLANFIVRHIDFTMMSQFFQHTLSLPVSFFAKRRTGDIFARFQENQTIRNFLTESTVSTILNLLMLFLYFIVLFLYSVKMTLLLIMLVIPMALLTLIITPKIKAYARRDFEASTDAEAVLMETLSGAETIKAMGIERPMRMQWERKYAKALNVQYDAQRFQALVVLVGQMLQATATIVLLWVGANLVLSQELSIGQLIAFNMLMGSVMAPIMGLIKLWDELHEAGVAMERLGDVLDMEPEQKPENLPSRVMLPGMQGDIRFDGVYFRYGGKETPYVLENISFELRAGETVAVVGLSGSGKTTLAKLLVGFYPPSEGKILVDDYDLTLLDKEYYRAQIGYVMQNNLLFSGTVVENIALGVENPDRRRVDEVSRLADAHGFISKLPLGYEQVVGERGVGLSGGQMQRICIARALYHDPRLLIFDEATSALDTQSEANILKNMQDVIAGRTALIIAHRLSTVMSADKILALYQGSIVEEGTHQELLDRQGMYYQLVQKQISA